jgi:hypothetical protein
MFWLKSVRVLPFICVLLISVTAKTETMQRIATGTWGGQHIVVKVGEKSATVEYDCATGVIDGPLVLDSKGHFKLHGTHKMERGGPVRLGDDARQVPATFTGSIKGHTMTLTLKFADSDEETFTLEKGKEGELFKCK